MEKTWPLAYEILELRYKREVRKSNDLREQIKRLRDELDRPIDLMLVKRRIEKLARRDRVLKRVEDMLKEAMKRGRRSVVTRLLHEAVMPSPSKNGSE
ncbi:MAG: hypothetical protein IH874_03935 [Candidatus Dadabacteria bacterium]|nr:hypothetical protein [Candidatus Dadabacteria bacterium]